MRYLTIILVAAAVAAGTTAVLVRMHDEGVPVPRQEPTYEPAPTAREPVEDEPAVLVPPTSTTANTTPAPGTLVVRAQRFELVNARGEVQGSLFLVAGEPGLELRDTDGNPRVQIGTLNNETVLRLYGADKRLDVQIRTEAGDPVVELLDTASRSVVQIKLMNGEPHIHLVDVKRRNRVVIALTNGDPVIQCYGPNSPKTIWQAP